MKQEKKNNRQRKRRKFRIRNKIKRFSTRPRMSVFRSHKHLYVQIIDDLHGKTLCAASTLDKDLQSQLNYGGNCQAAEALGRVIAERALSVGVKQVAFDRREYKYHGRLAALADAARDAGLDMGAKAPEPEPKPDKSPKKKNKKKKAKA